MSRIVYERFREICPSNKLADMSVADVEHDCKVAFRIIDYEPKDFEKALKVAWEKSNATMLYEFIFDVYINDVE